MSRLSDDFLGAVANALQERQKRILQIKHGVQRFLDKVIATTTGDVVLELKDDVDVCAPFSRGLEYGAKGKNEAKRISFEFHSSGSVSISFSTHGEPNMHKNVEVDIENGPVPQAVARIISTIQRYDYTLYGPAIAATLLSLKTNNDQGPCSP